MQPQKFDSDDSTDRESGVLTLQICFIVFVFFEALIGGMIPTFWTSCRESPLILGIANSFACGLFLAISLIHITPECSEDWAELDINTHEMPQYPGLDRQPNDKIFPLPPVMVFVGYTIILMMDKVLFDSKSLFVENKGEDPAKVKLENSLRASMTKAQAVQGDASVGQDQRRASQKLEQEEVDGAVKDYMNPNDRFATRMKASMEKKGSDVNEEERRLVGSLENYSPTSDNGRAINLQ